MKNNSKISVAFALISVILAPVFTSCKDMLKEQNFGQPTVDEMMQNEENIISLIGQAYADLKFVHDHWGYWGVNILTADEACCPTSAGGDWNDGGYWKNLNTHNWNAYGDAFRCIWNVTVEGAVLCNNLLQTLDNGKDNMNPDLYNQYVGEVEVLRSYYYYMLFDCFGRIPYMEDYSDRVEPLMEPQVVWAHLVECLERNADNMEEVTDADRTRLIDLANEIDTEVMRLANSFKTGQAIKNGIPVAIIGAPNVGKSTLLNALLKEDRAIVSDIQGTTRDVIEDTITLGGFLFRFIDTAGIRTTDDRIEQLGIERSRQAASRANIIILLTEPGVQYIDIEARPDQHVLRIENKTDQFQALTGLGIDALEQQLIDLATPTNSGDIILTNQRHYQALTSAHQSLLQVIAGLNANLSGDLIAEDLRAVIASLNEILGKNLTITSQSALNLIFSRFCIGK